MVKCLICGKEYKDGTYHAIHCGIVYKNDRKYYNWNCVEKKKSSLHDIKEEIITSFMNKKVNSTLAYE